MLRWLYVDLNSYFASCEQQERPAMRGKPLGVVPVRAETTCAIAASYEAKKFGVKTGTVVSEARRLCPGIKFVVARPKLYVEYHHRILEAIETCIPVAEVGSIDEVACRLSGDETQPEKAIELAGKIKAAIRTRVGECLTSSIGIAPNPLLAKLASDMQKPDGLVVLRSEDLPQKILPLKLQDFPGIGPRMAQRFYKHGIGTVEQMWQLDTLRMRAIFGGVAGLKFHGALHGEDWRSGETHTSVIGHQHVLPPALRNTKDALGVLLRLLEKGAERMRKKGYYCTHLTLQVRLDKREGYLEHDCRFDETQDTSFLMARVRELWAALPPHVPQRVGIVLSGLVEAGHHQLNLFISPRKEAAIKAVDTLNQRYGRGTVHFGWDKDAQERVVKDKIAFQRVPEKYEV